MRLWRKPKTLVWHTDLSKRKCLERLGEEVGTSFISLADIFGPLAKKLLGRIEPVCGRIGSDGFRLQKRQMWGYHNNFMPLLYGKLIDEPVHGTRIEVHFDVHPFTKGFMYVIYAVAVAMGAGVLVGTASRPVDGNWLLALLTGVGIGLLVSAGAAGAFWLFSKLCWCLNGGDVEFLTEFMRRVLHARPVENDASECEMHVRS